MWAVGVLTYVLTVMQRTSLGVAGLEAAGGFLVLAVGYGGCFALWHFVFSPRNRHDDDLDRTRSEEFLE